MPDDLSGLHEPFVEWVYDHSNDTPLGEVDVQEFIKTQSRSFDEDASWRLLRQTKERGYVDDRFSTLGTPAANLTDYGREWVEARRRRRGDKVQRMIVARNGLLRWLWEKKQDGVAFPVPEHFLKSNEAQFEGETLSPEEVDRAAASLVDRGLIHGAKALGLRGPIRAETTDEGDRCVEQYSGDVMEYEQAKHRGGPTISFGGDNRGNFAVGDHNQQTSTVFGADTAAKVMKVIEQYRQAKPTITLPAEVEAEVTELFNDLEEQVNSEAPNVGRIRKALQQVGNHLNMAAAGALGNLIAAGALELAGQLH